jgi:hypothetical protein
MAKLQINVDGVLRDMTADELAQYELDQVEVAKLKEVEATKAAAKAALLERLGISADEAAILLS